jgi:hypothetical protein
MAIEVGSNRTVVISGLDITITPYHAESKVVQSVIFHNPDCPTGCHGGPLAENCPISGSGIIDLFVFQATVETGGADIDLQLKQAACAPVERFNLTLKTTG